MKSCDSKFDDGLVVVVTTTAMEFFSICNHYFSKSKRQLVHRYADDYASTFAIQELSKHALRLLRRFNLDEFPPWQV